MFASKIQGIFMVFLYKLVASEQDCTQSICKLPESSLRFFILGDFGGQPVYPYYTRGQKKVAKEIALKGTTWKTHFQIELGDNFYMTGVEDVNDTRFQKTFSDIYDESPAMFKPWYIIAGNHDHYGNISAQIAYSQVESRWKFPSLYYQVRYELPNGTLIEILMLDTIVLCGNSRDLEYSEFGVFDLLTTHSRQPCCPKNITATNNHWKWLEDKLNQSKADYLFLAGHFPVYSTASHGPTDCLVKRLEPLLHKYKVTAYFAGHEHNLQHLVHESDGWSVHYIVSGSASKADYSDENEESVPEGSLKFRSDSSLLWNPLGQLGFTNGGYVYAEVDSESAKFQYYTGTGKYLYQFSLIPRSKLLYSKYA